MKKTAILTAEVIEKDNDLRNKYVAINGGGNVADLNLSTGTRVNAVVVGGITVRSYDTDFKNPIKTETDRNAQGVILRSISAEYNGVKYNASVTPDLFETLKGMPEEQRPGIGDSIILSVRTYGKVVNGKPETKSFFEVVTFTESVILEESEVEQAEIAG